MSFCSRPARETSQEKLSRRARNVSSLSNGRDPDRVLQRTPVLEPTPQVPVQQEVRNRCIAGDTNSEAKDLRPPASKNRQEQRAPSDRGGCHPAEQNHSA